MDLILFLLILINAYLFFKTQSNLGQGKLILWCFGTICFTVYLNTVDKLELVSVEAYEQIMIGAKIRIFTVAQMDNFTICIIKQFHSNI